MLSRGRYFATVLAAGCAASPAPAPESATAPSASAPAAPAEPPAPSSGPVADTAEPGTTNAPAPATGIASCDAYLASYQACEPKLTAQIQSGERRTFVAERAWLVYMKGTPEGANLPSACAGMAEALEKSGCAR